MIESFESIISELRKINEEDGSFSPVDFSDDVENAPSDSPDIAQALNAAFLCSLGGSKSRRSDGAKNFIVTLSESPAWKDVARFYSDGLDLVQRELEDAYNRIPHFGKHLNELSQWVSKPGNLKASKKTAEKFWNVFFPEGAGIRGQEKERIQALRSKRHVTITDLNTNPLTDPARQVLFTSNVLLTVPLSSKSPDRLFLSRILKEKLKEIIREPQLFWYDHPIPVGVKTDENEANYGLQGLDKAFEFEYARGNITEGNRKPMVLLSVSVTHQGLHDIARAYLEAELLKSGGLKCFDVCLFTETDTDRIVNEILAVAADHYMGRGDAAEHLGVFGVDGRYGRHYSFLKAIAAFLGVFVSPDLKATFKIDLDQVFPQKELVKESHASAFEHLMTPLWGAKGHSRDGQSLDLGLIAGALVNEQDIGKSIFTPDVQFTNHAPSNDELFFFSSLPQALSTEAEMMARYDSGESDGKGTCIQRFHVTGGTNGITLESLRRYRPFTPSFIGRAEDQAYILSILNRPGIRLAYLHKAGLFMRHDKTSFAQENMRSASVSKLIGDYVRIILFSAYARVLSDDISGLKEEIDPFTGCFVSMIPATVVHLRFGFKAAWFFENGQSEQGIEFIKNGAARIGEALNFVKGENSMLKQSYKEERLGWNLYYDILSVAEDAIKRNDQFALNLRKKANSIVDDCTIRFE